VATVGEAASRRRSRLLPSLGGLVVAALVVYALVPGGRQSVDELAAQGGPLGRVVPWLDRAESALRRLMDGPSGATAASVIQRTTHPTGTGARLRSYDVRRLKDSINVRISTSWEGGFTGAGYTTDVVWEFDEARHLSAVVVSDDALVGVAAENARSLDDYFRLEFYPVLCSNAGS
jgi:hypothetical protein